MAGEADFEQTALLERVKSLEKSLQEMQREQKAKEEWSSQQLHSLEKQLSLSHLSSSSSPSSPSSPHVNGKRSSSMPVARSPGLAYSSSFKNPQVPCMFQMPLHYPKYKEADYDTMPEWKLDRLLEEYGLPVLGTLREKKQYAMGVFLWRNKEKQQKE